jgi:hypothetical protein
MDKLSTDEQARVTATLRPQEELLWVGKALAVIPTAQPQRPLGLLAKFKKLLSSPPQTAATTAGPLYLLTAKRAVVLTSSGDIQEWPVMLGMIQKVNEEPDGSGDVIFDHDYDERTETRTPRGFLRVVDVDRVRMLVSSAADAAYNASPWSV